MADMQTQLLNVQQLRQLKIDSSCASTVAPSIRSSACSSKNGTPIPQSAKTDSATAMILSPTPTLDSATTSAYSDLEDDESEGTIGDSPVISPVSKTQASAKNPTALLQKPKNIEVVPFVDEDEEDEEDDLVEDWNTQPSHLSANEWRARRAVHHAMCSNETFDRFDVVSIVGFGSNGAVLAARPRGRDAPRDVLLAIKIIYKAKSATVPCTANDPWPHEVLLHRRLSAHHSHRNLLHSHAHFQDAKYFYIVLDLVDVDWLARFSDPSAGGGVTATFSFDNPRTHRRHRVEVSPGGKADLWAWSVDATTLPGHESKPTANPVPPPVEACRALFRDIAGAVRHLHRLGVHHGDLKPENVLVAPASPSLPHAARIRNVSARLCDLGHARHSPVLDAPEHRLGSYGTRELSAPELLPNLALGAPAASRRRVDAFKLDIFALGTLLYTLLHGPARLPTASTAAVRAVASVPYDVLMRDYAGVDPRAIVFRLAGCDVDARHWDLPGLLENDLHPRLRTDADLVDLLRGMLRVDPKRRFGIEDVCAHPWVTAA
ncbi:hypothetical protein HK405_011969, partial [Cladochytrium tenue]